MEAWRSVSAEGLENNPLGYRKFYLEGPSEGPENNALGYQKFLLEGHMDPNIQAICNKFLYGDIPKFAYKIHDSHLV